MQKKNLAPRKLFTEEKFGIKIEDNYRYFEDTENQEALAWIKAQHQFTQEQLNENHFVENWLKAHQDLEKKQPFQVSRLRSQKNHYYYVKRFSGETKGKLYRLNKQSRKETLLFDFDVLSKKYEQDANLQAFSISPNEKYIGMLIGLDGNEYGLLHFLNLETLILDKECIDNVRSFSPCWISDTAFLYAYFPHIKTSNENKFHDKEMRWHKMGEDSTKDVTILSAKQNQAIENWVADSWFEAEYCKETEQLYIYHTIHTDKRIALYQIAWKDILKKPFKKIFGFEDKITMACIDKEIIYYQTHFFSTKQQLRKSTLHSFNHKKSILLFKEEDQFFEESQLAKDESGIYFICSTKGYTRLYQINKNNNQEINEIAINEKGVWGMPYALQENLFFFFTNFKTPDTYFEINAKNELQVISELVSHNENSFDKQNYVVKTEEYASYDGEMIPISYIHHKDIKLNGKNRCLIMAYGAYGYGMLQYFTLETWQWLQQGGIYAIAHVRGGGEKGIEWHKAGQKDKKANTWKDLIGAGEYLIAKKYTSPAYLACEGGSAGGITVGMASIERPDLWGAVVATVGNHTPSRKGQNAGGGISEMGNPDIEEDFKNLLKMDTVHNIKKGAKFPNILFIGGMKDDRVDYWQPAKACAKMQYCNTDTTTEQWLFCPENLGHAGMGSSYKETLNMEAHIYAFLDRFLN